MKNGTRKIKSWEELTLADNFIFQKFMMNEELCKKVISEIIGKEVIQIEYPEYEKTLEERYDAKGIRLDVYVKGENEVYNIEMQNSSTAHLPKRGRYYQGLIDLDLLDKGEEYSKLCHNYIIFICTYDYYGRNQYKYTFTNRCKEINDLEYGDETTKIVLNTQGEEGEVSDDLKIFLKSVNGVFSDDEFSAKIKEEYEKVKSSRKWRREYMTLEMALQEREDIGIQKLEEAILTYKRGADTVEKLLAEGVEEKIAEKTIKLMQ